MIQPGSKLAHYEVVSALGKGGMGEVYRARDTKLGREVAIKVLPSEFSQDPERLARLEREARMLAALNHPNIAAIHGLEESDDTRFLVLELVEGDTLAERLKRGAIPVEESLKLALQIAEALEAAHDKGVIHRDLKPANVKITPEGRVKILDFGLAKAFIGEQTDVNLSNSPTLSMQATQQGMILGTAAYMSPEQAKGRLVDKRTDLWALGTILYEMLTSRQAFRGDEVSEILASVLAREPDYAHLQANLNPRVQRLVHRCLEKDTKKRWQDTGDVRIEIEELLADRDGVALLPFPEGVRPARAAILIPIVAIAFVVGAGLMAAIVWTRSAPPSQDVTRLTMETFPGTHLGNTSLDNESTRGRPTARALAFAPDGRSIVYSGALDEGADTAEEGVLLYLRRMGEDRAVPIPGTEAAMSPFFSPDGQSLGFFKAGELMRVPVGGGEPRTIATSGPAFATGSVYWAEDDNILLTTDEGLFRVPSGGGTLEQLTEVSTGEPLHAHPEMLPGGEAILFNVGSGDTPSQWDIVAQSLDSEETVLLVEGGSDPSYVSSGHIVFARDGTLMAVPFDASSLQVLGDPVVVIEDVMQAERGGNSDLNTGNAQFTVSDSGSLAYVPGGPFPVGGRLFNWVDLDGNIEPLPLPARRYLHPRLSPDGTRLAYAQGVFGDIQVWIYDIALGVSVPLTSEGENAYVIWSPDGTDIALSNRTAPDVGLYLMTADGSGELQRLTESDATQHLASWSSGNVLVYLEGRKIMTLSIAEGSEPDVFLESDFPVTYPTLSPNGNWIAYSSNDTGQFEVYVRPFPEGKPAYRISTDGGTAPLWLPDGEQLVYMAEGEDGSVPFMIVDVTTEPQFTRSQPRLLFEGPFLRTGPIRSYDISPDGERFVIETAEPVEPEPVYGIKIVQNWVEELKELVPVP